MELVIKTALITMPVLFLGIIALRLLGLTPAGWVKVEGHSMKPTIENGDEVLVLFFWPKQLIAEGQVVVIIRPEISRQFASLDDHRAHKWSIKRVAKIIRREQWSRVDSGMRKRTSRNWMVDQPDEEGKISAGLFVLGDGPGADSRAWGLIPFDSVKGIAVARRSRREGFVLL